MSSNEQLRAQVILAIQEYYKNLEKEKRFVPGQTPILTGEAVFGAPEVSAMADTILDGWFGLGKKGEEFEKTFASYLPRKHSVLVNSGSTANLLALNSAKVLYGLDRGEIITPAATFPTTFNPILQLGFTPAVVDVDASYNLSPGGLEKALSSKTVGIMFAHTLGNPAKVAEIRDFADKHGLFVIEDCCDALGAGYNQKVCGTYGLLSTFSFYPAHGITMGEGGLVATDNPDLKKILRSLRDWGRDCWCNTDEKNTLGACRSRFDFRLDGVPYDHKYIYSQIGYNVKPLELQAAMGLEQLKRLPEFVEIRKRNYAYYMKKLASLSEFFDFPEVNPGADPVFFGLPLTLKDSKHNRKNLTVHLNNHKIATRLLFAGNITKQPAYRDSHMRVCEDLKMSDKLMRDCFWIGVHAGITPEHIDYVSDKLAEYFRKV